MGKYSAILRRATNSVDYWTQAAIRAFVRDLTNRMDAKGITQAELAERIGTSPAYVSKIMRGDANFTLESMTKLAMAVGAKAQVAIVDGSPMERVYDSSAPKWGLFISARSRVARSNVLNIVLENEMSAANAWEFGSVTHVSSPGDLDEVRVA